MCERPQVLKLTTAIESLVGRYSQLANRLKLIPATSKRADGINYELKINRNAPNQVSNLLPRTLLPLICRELGPGSLS
jgi:hypothetical protein